jgi:DNA-binding CsgD family transcriptional regulator
LSYQDSFSFTFAALDYNSPSRNQFAYRLSDINDNWVPLGHKHDLTFANLEPGAYTLQIKGANNDGVWNEAGIEIGFTITPPFWRTWWFQTLAVLLVFGLALLWHRRRIRWKQLLLDNEADMERFFVRYKISRREREIINLILRGKSNKEIEERLFISMGTVKNHIYSIFQKVGVKSRGQLIIKIVNSPQTASHR